MPTVQSLRSAAAIAALGTLFACATAAQEWAQQARVALNAPSKVAIATTDQAPKADQPLKYVLTIKDAKGQPATLSADTPVQVTILDAGGDVAKKDNCNVQAHSSFALCSIQAPSSGLYQLKAEPLRNNLRDGMDFLLVRPAGTSEAKVAGSPSGRTPATAKPPANAKSSGQTVPSKPKVNTSKDKPPADRKGASLQRFFPEWLNRQQRGFHLIQASYEGQSGAAAAVSVPQACAAPIARGPARILLNIDDGSESGAFRAQLDAATITAFFQAEDGGSAPRDIFVWLSPDHGRIDATPLVIPRCNIRASAHLLSSSPTLATVSYTVDPATYPVAGEPKLQAHFVRPIVGVGIKPEGRQILSLIDQAPIVVEFFDAGGRTVASDSDRTIKFVSNNTLIGPKLGTIKLKSGDRSADNVVVPYRMGTAVLYVTADDLPQATHEFEVIGALVFVLCLLGGLLGGAVAHYADDKTALVRRLIIGVMAAIVLCWAYVFGMLPQIDSNVAHNYISVFVVATLGGYLGVKAIEMVLRKLGWLTA